MSVIPCEAVHGAGFSHKPRCRTAFPVLQHLLAFAAARGAGSGQQANQGDFLPAVLAERATAVAQKVQQALQAANSCLTRARNSLSWITTARKKA